MCGIIFVMKRDGSLAKKMVWKRYLDQKTRGQQGFGFVGIRDNKVIEYHRKKDEKEIEELLKDSEADTILFHHRYPTSTGNFEAAAHPIKVSHSSLTYDYYFAHNGIITNDDDVKKHHDTLGIPYSTQITYKTITAIEKDLSYKFNDSEALAIELALYLENKIETVRAHGSIAVVGIRVHKETQMVESYLYGRNYSNPLKVNNNAAFISVASEGHGTEPLPYNLTRLDPETKELAYFNNCIPGYTYRANYEPSHEQAVGFRRNKEPVTPYSTYSGYDGVVEDVDGYPDASDTAFADAMKGGEQARLLLAEKRTEEMIKSPFASIDQILAERKKLGDLTDTDYAEPDIEDLDIWEVNELITTTREIIKSLENERDLAIHSGQDERAEVLDNKIDIEEGNLNFYYQYRSKIMTTQDAE